MNCQVSLDLKVG